MIGTTLNQYHIIDRIGEGGMGVVYLAEDTRLDRKVALKFVSNISLDSTEEITRFHREARAAARLNHPNICTIHELGETEDKTFIAMEYVDGITLKERMRQGNIQQTNIQNWLDQIAEGLQTAHEAGVIHRDIKPANIMLSNKGLIKIMDFGIAKLAESETDLTKANSTIGTIAYMSPEQARGEKIDHRTDIWSVGIILYELTTGVRPFTGAFREAVMYAMMHEDPAPPLSINHGMPADLDQIINKCLQRERDDRYGSLEELLCELNGTLSSVKEKSNIETPGPSTEDSEQPTAVHPITRDTQTGLTWTKIIDTRKKRLVAGGLMILVTVLFFVPQFRAFISVSNTTRSLPAVMHLAVLPFDTINNSPEEKSFSNGLAHLVAINLMRMEHDAEEMWIIPVREVLSRGVISASEAKESFGVNLAVSGTIVNTPEALQIWLDVTDAQTLRVIDSDVIELEEMDPLIVQEQVMAKLARMLELRVPGDENVMLAGLTDDPEAYKLYVRSQGLIQEYMIEENVDEAIKLLEQAIERDSTFALAYAAAGFAYARKYYFTKDIDLFDLARARSEKSLELNDELVEVWTTLLLIKDRLERVNPNDPELLWSATEIHGKLRQVGTARIYFQRYLDLDRQDTYSLYRIFMGYELINDRDSALVYLERALEKGYAYAGGSWGPWFEDVWEDPRGQTILARY